jgi:hypothetical protein
MHDVLRARLIRHIEALPEAQLYQAIDYVEFLASKYARDSIRQPSSVQRFGELLEDKMRGQGLGLGTIRSTLGVLGTADRFLSGITEAGKTIIQQAGEAINAPASQDTARPVSAPQRQGDGDPNPGAAPAGGA